MHLKTSTLALLAGTTAAVLGTLAPDTARADYGHGNVPVTVYFTRHAEKKTTTSALGPATDTYELEWFDGNARVMPKMIGEASKGDTLDEVCGTDKCAEELNALGLARAELLADWFEQRGITGRLDAVYSTHKYRTYQTVAPTAERAGLEVMRLPAGGTELEPEGTTPSECPTIDAILGASPGDTLLVAGHSGTLYDIMGDGNDACMGLGLDTGDENRFPRDAKGKVRDFGDVWKVVIRHGEARFAYRVNLQPERLEVASFAR